MQTDHFPSRNLFHVERLAGIKKAKGDYWAQRLGGMRKEYKMFLLKQNVRRRAERVQINVALFGCEDAHGRAANLQARPRERNHKRLSISGLTGYWRGKSQAPGAHRAGS